MSELQIIVSIALSPFTTQYPVAGSAETVDANVAPTVDGAAI